MAKAKKLVSILGSTGSIGTQTLDVISKLPDEFELGTITANTNIDLLADQIRKYRPRRAVVSDAHLADELRSRVSFTGEILSGKEMLCEIASDTDNDLLVSSLVGFSGVLPTLSAINAGVPVALANKETLVSAGEIITGAARDNNVPIFAIDSEHSAVLQCLIGESVGSVEKIMLTASGGPFLDTPAEEFDRITVSQALAHPNWSMGSKITIDSATMMNKGFEIIEAYWLFGVPAEKIEVLVHPQSIVHSMVQFTDGSVKAQLGLPDMRIPISLALTYPERRSYDFPRVDFTKLPPLEFRAPDSEKFPCLTFAYDALKEGGSACAVVNAANEIAVAAFLDKRIPFAGIPKCIESVWSRMGTEKGAGIDEIVSIDLQARDIAEEFIKFVF